jgi:hypothetical protein
VALLCGRAERLTAQNVGSRPGQYAFFQELWDYVDNIIACLDAKVQRVCRVPWPEATPDVTAYLLKNITAYPSWPGQAVDIEECEAQLVDADRARADAFFTRQQRDLDDMAAEVTGAAPAYAAAELARGAQVLHDAHRGAPIAFTTVMRC